MKSRLWAMMLLLAALGAQSAVVVERGPNDPALPFTYEGARTQALQVDPAWVAIFPIGPSGSPLWRIDDPGQPAGQRSPVYRELGRPDSPARALPGGVIVSLRTEDRDRPDRLFDSLGLRVRRPIDRARGQWLIDAAPGAASLSLANALHESGRFEQVSPNWWRERVRK